jgi:hypothetical protein
LATGLIGLISKFVDRVPVLAILENPDEAGLVGLQSWSRDRTRNCLW